MADHRPTIRGRFLRAAAVLLVLAGAIAVSVVVLVRRPVRVVAIPTTASSTARVVRTDLTNTIQLTGALGYAGTYSVVNLANGAAYTWLPRPGSVLGRGSPVYEVDDRPAVLFLGARPAWRALSLGVDPGPDVRELEQNLVALGYADAKQLNVGDNFTAVTTAAVKRWQKALGLAQTGIVALGDVVFNPAPVRVTTVSAVLGSPPMPGALILSGTSTVRVVQTAIPVGQQYLLRPGQQVTVALPDAHTVLPGRIATVSTVATAAAEGGSSTTPSGGAAVTTVEVDITLTGGGAPGGVDQLPVSVNVVSAEAKAATAVPIDALVAVQGGGYAVRVMNGGGGTLVGVDTGLFTASLVQVTGSQLHEGDVVQVPAS